mmetsp:Transcript_25524/g.70261  ORF Transcript_25524/g.70261 Transcript_25524/m.70261 type:complete len:337 (+) Transcript_25524:248-1258(+)
MKIREWTVVPSRFCGCPSPSLRRVFERTREFHSPSIHDHESIDSSIRRRLLPKAEPGRDSNVPVGPLLFELDEIPRLELEHFEKDGRGVAARDHVLGELPETDHFGEMVAFLVLLVVVVIWIVIVIVIVIGIGISEALFEVRKDPDRVLVPLGRGRGHVPNGLAILVVVIVVVVFSAFRVRIEDHVVDHSEIEGIDLHGVSFLLIVALVVVVSEIGHDSVHVHVLVVHGGRKVHDIVVVAVLVTITAILGRPLWGGCLFRQQGLLVVVVETLRRQGALVVGGSSLADGFQFFGGDLVSFSFSFVFAVLVIVIVTHRPLVGTGLAQGLPVIVPPQSL